MLKKLLAVAGLSVMVSFSGASATHQTETVTVVDRAEMQVGIPAPYHPHEVWKYGVLDERVNSCPGDDTFEGYSGVTFAIGVDSWNRPGVMTLEGEDAYDADVYWYDGSCNYIEDETWATEAKSESGLVPDGAEFGTINFYDGFDGVATLTYTRPVAD